MQIEFGVRAAFRYELPQSTVTYADRPLCNAFPALQFTHTGGSLDSSIVLPKKSEILEVVRHW